MTVETGVVARSLDEAICKSGWFRTILGFPGFLDPRLIDEIGPTIQGYPVTIVPGNSLFVAGISSGGDLEGSVRRHIMEYLPGYLEGRSGRRQVAKLFINGSGLPVVSHVMQVLEVPRSKGIVLKESRALFLPI